MIRTAKCFRAPLASLVIRRNAQASRRCGMAQSPTRVRVQTGTRAQLHVGEKRTRISHPNRATPARHKVCPVKTALRIIETGVTNATPVLAPSEALLLRLLLAALGLTQP
jgi:hypothetical protein